MELRVFLYLLIACWGAIIVTIELEDSDEGDIT